MRGEGTGTPRVAVVIPTWNRKADILRCLSSLQALAYPNAVTVVVDNGSEDGTTAAVRQHFPECVVLASAVNVGYAGGNNLGMRWALAHGADHVLLINNDAKVTPGLVTELVRVADQDARIAAVGSRNLVLEDPTQLWGAFGVLTYGPFVVRTDGRGAPDEARWQVIKDVDWLIGNGALLRRAALEDVGLFDETFFAYHEDVDWCMRAHRKGYRVVYAGTAAILHRGGSSSAPGQTHSFPRAYFLGRNGVLFVRKHARWTERIRFALLCGVAFAGRLGRAAALQLAPRGSRARRRGADFWATERLFGRGSIDALRGRPVPFGQLGLPRCAILPQTAVGGCR